MPNPEAWLTRGGQLAALLVGAAALLAGWGWAALLVAYFVAASLVTQVGRAAKAERTVSVLSPATARNAIQVMANGSVFALGALVFALGADAWAAVAALGALAASAADTWATEIGLLSAGTPRSVLSLAPLEPGTSGGVTAAGLAASAIAALLVAVASVWLLAPLGVEPTVALSAVATGGVVGSLADSVLGGTVQARRQCEACGAWTERQVHSCGGATRHARGLRWMTNDTVNLAATLIGAAAALGVAAALR